MSFSPLLSIVWQPVAPPLYLFGAAAVLAALVVVAYGRTIRERPLAGALLCLSRLVVLGALVVALLGPSALRNETRNTARPLLTILLDTSESMRTEDASGICRLEAARSAWLAPKLLDELGRDFILDLNAFDEDVRPLRRPQLESSPRELASGRATHLAHSVTSAVARIPAQQLGTALLVVSDGRDSQDAPIQPAAALARSRDVPVFTVLVGRDSHVSDAAVLAVPMQDYLLPGESGAILVKVYQSGLGASATMLHVKTGDREQTVPVAFQGKPVVEVQIPVRHQEPGQYEYTVRLDALPEEATDTNNTTTVFVDVQRKRIKVLLVEGAPYWDTKFLAQSLRKDERIEVTQISQLSRAKRETIVTRAEAGSPQVPQSAEDWARYDVVILGRGLEHVLDAKGAGQLADCVLNHGGHVIFARGRAVNSDRRHDALSQALSRIEPVTWGEGEIRDVRLALAPAGRLSQWLAATKMGVDVERALERLPGLETLPLAAREKTAAVVLARGVPGEGAPNAGGPPALVQMSVGRGSVMAILGDGLWRWSLLTDEQQDLLGLYDSFWSNLVRWMTMGGDFPPGQQISLKLARTTSRLGDALPVDVVCRQAPAGGAAPFLELTGQDGRTQQIVLERRPGREPRFQASLAPPATGIYRVVLKAPGLTPSEQEQRFSVYDVNEERLNTLVNPMPLKVLAEHTGGAFFEIDQVDAFLDRIRRHRQSLVAPPRADYLWDDWRLMAILLTWAGVEWLMRRNMGLV